MKQVYTLEERKQRKREGQKRYRDNNKEKLREYYRLNRKKIILKTRIYHLENKHVARVAKNTYRTKKYRLIDHYRNKPCSICYVKYDLMCNDFHHKNPLEKIAPVSNMIRQGGFTQEQIIAEIEKCNIICANCHNRSNRKTEDGVLAKWFVNYLKTLKCERCELNHSLEFHHKDPSTKIMEVTRMVKRARKYSKQDVLDEIKKCEVLCRNCHRLRERHTKILNQIKNRLLCD